MAGPVVRDYAYTPLTASGTTHAVNIPAGVLIDQLLLLFSATNASGANDHLTRSGWTNFAFDDDPRGKVSALYKKATATEIAAAGSTLDFVTIGSCQADGVMVRLSDWHGTTAPEGNDSNSFSAAAAPATVDPSWGAEDTRYIVAVTVAGGISGYPSDCPDDHHSDVPWGLASADISATSFDPETFTNGNTHWTAWNVGVRGGTAGPEIYDLTIEQDPALLALDSGTQTVPYESNVHQQSALLALGAGEQSTDAPVLRAVALVGPDRNTPDRTDEDVAGLDAMVLPVLRRVPGDRPAWYDIDSDLGSDLRVKEQDGAPSVLPVTEIRVPNGTLTDEGSGAVSLGYATSGHAHALDDLSDVVITSPVLYDRLRYDGSVWRNSALIWRPLMVEDVGTGLWYVVTDGGGSAIMVEG